MACYNTAGNNSFSMKKKLRIFLLILFASLLCGVSLVACRFAKAEDGQPAIADIYQEGRIIRTVHLPGWPQHPQELSDWIAHNNTKIYHITPVTYVPKVRLAFPGQNRHFCFLTGAVSDGSYIRSATKKDTLFVDWLLTQPGTEPMHDTWGNMQNIDVLLHIDALLQK